MKIRKPVNPVLLELDLDEVIILGDALYHYKSKLMHNHDTSRNERDRKLKVCGEMMILLDLLI